MKIQDYQNIQPIDLNVSFTAVGGIIETLRQPDSYIERKTLNPSIYSEQGFIKGLSRIDQIKHLKYGFSTQSFGNMAFKFGPIREVIDNRAKFIKAVGLNLKNTVFMHPNHGKGIKVVDFSYKGRGARHPGTSVGPVDALITFEKGVALALNAADCAPLIITSNNSDVLALVHAGRVGTDAKIAKTTIKKIMSYGIKAQDLVVGIGPAIQKSCYKLEYLETANPYQWLPWIRPVSKPSKIKVEKMGELGKLYQIKAETGKILVDIVGFNIAQLLEMGVKAENIETVPVCALCMAKKGEIFSHSLSMQYKQSLPSAGDKGKNSNLYPEGRFMSIAQLS